MDPIPEDSALDRDVRSLPEKLHHLLSLAGLNDDQFCEDFCATQDVRDRRTPRAWLRGTTIAQMDPPHSSGKNQVHSHIPGKRNLGKIGDYFKAKLGIREFPLSLFYCDFEQFASAISELLKTRAETNLEIPIAHRLGRISDTNGKVLCGKYIFYRYSMRDTGKVVSEIFTLSRPGKSSYLDIQLYSYAVYSEEPECFSGKFFRYGKLYSAVLTFTDPQRHDHMRVLTFPEVSVADGVYSGLMMSYSSDTHEAAAMRTIAMRYAEDTAYDEDDLARTTVLEANAPELVDVLPLLTNQIFQPDVFVLTSQNKPGPLAKLKRS